MRKVIKVDSPKEFIQEMGKMQTALPKNIDINPRDADKGLAKLVLTLLELLRKLMEKQAIRRIEGRLLTEEEIENVGQALMKLEAKMQELKEIFGLKDDDLKLNLGPLGDLM